MLVFWKEGQGKEEKKNLLKNSRDFPGGAVVKNPPMRGAWVQALAWEDPTCRGATKPVRHNY